MKLINQMPVYNDTSEEALEKHNIEKLIEYERYCRDMQMFDEEKECFSDDSYVRITWFNGSGKEFVENSSKMSRELWSAPKHKIYNTFVWLNGDKGVAEAQCMMGAYHNVRGVQYHRLGWARLLYRVQKEEGIWKVKGMDCIYERDMLVPVIPNGTVDPTEFEGYRDSYKCISWLFEKQGMPCNNNLPGDDKPLIVKELYEEVTNWLYQDQLLPRLIPLQGEAYRARMERVGYLEKNDAERYTGEEPVELKTIYDALLEDNETAREKYYEKRIVVTGIVTYAGPDVWGVPCFEVSDSVDGRCYGLTVFFTDDIYQQAKAGDRVTILGNILNIREPYGCVIKKCELLKVE